MLEAPCGIACWKTRSASDSDTRSSHSPGVSRHSRKNCALSIGEVSTSTKMRRAAQHGNKVLCSSYQESRALHLPLYSGCSSARTHAQARVSSGPTFLEPAANWRGDLAHPHDPTIQMKGEAHFFCVEGVYIQQGRKRTPEHHPRGKGGGGRRIKGSHRIAGEAA
jgi:hypothetical protein